MSDYVEDLAQVFQSERNSDYAAYMKDCMKGHFDFFGLSDFKRKSLQAPFLSKSGLPQKEDAKNIIRKLWIKPERELQYFAQDMFAKYQGHFEKDDIDLLEFMIINKPGNDTVDFIAFKLLRPYFKKFPEQIPVYDQKWMESGNSWLARCSMMFHIRNNNGLTKEKFKSLSQKLTGARIYLLDKALTWLPFEERPLGEYDTGPGPEAVPSKTPPRAIGVKAAELDRKRTVSERMKVSKGSRRDMIILTVIYFVIIGGMFLIFGDRNNVVPIIPLIVLIAFIFETADSAAGMGFGTGLAPLLFIMGYGPLQVVPVLLLSETITGLVSGFVHQSVDNVSFKFSPLNSEARLLLMLVIAGSSAVLVSVMLTYFAFEFSDKFIHTYVAVLVLIMGLIGLLRTKLRTRMKYRPKRLIVFAILAGINKGVGGGGFGPVVTLGQIFSGVYEKSAVGITSLAEGVVSVVGVLTFFLLISFGVPVDLGLLPSIFAGGFLAAIVAPYMVRVVPNAIWRYFIPIYAFLIGLIGLLFGFDV